ncbi:hypothetical protein AXF42_Ash001274 [Apostasia shenzhenica]|uniref:Uncharacterized protein n=1 Tax=Apostasia shenzhenica TaxID=1088818 RepID=A0A2I0AUF9_9ASPA|nr:hypothetical protein AXF42_Ash001274 [Apostasia shenzhenica]
MGCCFSSNQHPDTISAADDWSVRPPTAVVIAVDGSLLEYAAGATAGEVVGASGLGCALCCSDKLFFDAYPVPAPLEEELQMGQIYFLLPEAELRLRISGADAAALAIKATAAMKRESEKQGRLRRIRVAPEVIGGGDPIPAEFCPAAAVASEKEKTVNKQRRGGRLRRLQRILSTVEEADDEE